MGAPFNVEYGVGVGKQLLVVGIVVLERNVDGCFRTVRIVRIGNDVAEGYRVLVQHALGAIEKSNVFGYAVVELEVLALVGPLVIERNAYPRVQECQFPQALSEDVILESSRFGENLRSGLKLILVPDFLVWPITLSLLVVLPWLSDLVDLAVLVHLSLEPFRNGVDALGSDPVQATGYLVALPNLPPAWRLVSTSSRAGMLYFGWMSTGMPRPSSSTEQEPSKWMETLISLQKPARASSIELSTTSNTQ